MKKKLLFLMLSVLTLGAWAETSITDVLPKGATTVFTAKYQYGARGEGDVWPDDPANDGSDRAWYAKDFDDSSWKTKKVPFGSDLSDDQKWEGEYNCYWLRISFNIDAVDNTATYYFLCRHDDTYKAYINGNKIADRSGWTGNGYCYVPISGSYLSAGTNVIAVYIRQNNGGSYFDCGVQKYNYQQSDFDTRFKGVEVTNGEFYLYNPASGLWLQNNDRISSDWNTRAELGFRGLDFTLTLQENGGYYLNGKFKSNVCPSIQAGNRYLDTNSADAWHFEKVNVPGLTNAYKVTYWPTDQNDFTFSGSEKNPEHKSNNMYTEHTADNNVILDCLRTGINNYSIWVLVTKEQRQAMMQTGTSANPQDATWFIKNADLADNDDRSSAWSMTEGKFNYNWRNDDDNTRNGRCYESFNKENVEFKQTISNLPEGRYRMRVQGFYRSGEAKMFAGTNEQALRSETTTEEGWVIARRIYNDAGYIGNWMEFTHSGGDLDIGIKKGTKSTDTDWIVFSKFEMQYIGTDLSNLIEICEAQNTNHDAAFATAINDAKTTDNPSTALTNLRLARKIYAADKQDDIFGRETTPENNKYYYLYNVGQKRFFCGGDDWGAHAAVGFPGIQILLCDQDGSSFRIDTRLQNGNNEHYLNYGGYCDTNTNDKWTFTRNADGTYAIARSNDTSNLLGYRPGTYCRIDTDMSGADNADNKWIFVTEAERSALLESASASNPMDASFKIKMPNFSQREYVIDGGWQKTTDNENGAWTMTYDGTGGRGIWGRGGNHPDFVFESWNDATLDLNQEITDLPSGVYKVSVQGYYRHGNYEQQVTDFTTSSVKTDGAYLYANGLTDKTQYLKPITSERNMAPGEGRDGAAGRFPDACTMAATYFEYGLYKNELEVEVGTDGKLTIGVIKTQNEIANDWVVVDNFRLTYLGPTSESVTVSPAGYATYCSNRDLDFTSTSYIKAYVGKKNGDKLTFTPVTQVPANTGLLLVYEGGKTEDVPVIASASAVEGNCLVGVNEETTINSNDYILNKVNDGGAGFYKAGTYTTLGAHKAYIPAAVGGSVKGFTISLDDDATAIEMVNGQSSMVNGSIYNLAGQRLSKTQKGINIVNGKKVLK